MEPPECCDLITKPALFRFHRENLPPHIRWQVLTILRAIWPEDFTGERSLPSTIFRPEWPSTHVVLLAGEHVIAHAGFVTIDLVHSGEQVKMAGMGAVVTFPGFRGRGFGDCVVAEATRLIDESAADVASLFCEERLIEFYARLGWQHLEHSLTTLGDAAKPHLETETRMMRFLTDHGMNSRDSFEKVPWHLTHRW